jgi:putative membrane protein
VGFLLRLIVNAAALWVAAQLVPGIVVAGLTPLLLAALVLGLINAIVRPILIILTLPLTLLTLGLFIFVINGLLFWFVGSFIKGFTVGGFWTAVFGAIVYSVISWALSSLILKREP